MDTILNIVSSAILSQDMTQRPKVCLTWAQSLDGRLSISSNAPTLISGNQAMQMTHALRALHQTILIGIGTLTCDNPRLTCRMDPSTRAIVDTIMTAAEVDQRSDSGKSQISSYDPIPVILDSSLRTPPEARCLHARSDPQSVRPFIFHHSAISPQVKTDPLSQLVQAIQVPLLESRNFSKSCLDLRAVLYELWKSGIKNVMVEGGASVLSSFLNTDLWDIIVVTVSPQLFRSGVHLQATEVEGSFNLTQFRNSKWIQLGNDIVFIGFP